MKEWKLKDCCLSISDGDHLPPPKSSCGIPFITISNIDSTNHIDFGNTLFVPIEYYNNLDSIRKPQVNDILYSVVGSFGKPVLIKDGKPFVFQRHIAILRPNCEVVDSRYLYYVMSSRIFYLQADTVALGAAQRTISLTSLRNMKVSLPELVMQQRIADVLSSYDNLIENNTHRIRLLEQMAENIYKEWFIRFRFPGHENAEFENGLPKGWTKVASSTVIDIMSGGTPKTDRDEFYNGKIPFFTPKDANDSIFVYNTLTYITEEGLAHCNSQYYPVDTLMVTARGTVGKLSLLAVPMAMNQSCFALKFKDNQNPYYLYYAMKNEVARLKKMANGGVFDTIIIKTFDHISLVIPTDGMFRAFNKIITPIFGQIQHLERQNHLLARQRDLLLPRLMSGKLEVH